MPTNDDSQSKISPKKQTPTTTATTNVRSEEEIQADFLNAIHSANVSVLNRLCETPFIIAEMLKPDSLFLRDAVTAALATNNETIVRTLIDAEHGFDHYMASFRSRRDSFVASTDNAAFDVSDFEENIAVGILACIICGINKTKIDAETIAQQAVYGRVIRDLCAVERIRSLIPNGLKSYIDRVMKPTTKLIIITSDKQNISSEDLNSNTTDPDQANPRPLIVRIKEILNSANPPKLGKKMINDHQDISTNAVQSWRKRIFLFLAAIFALAIYMLVRSNNSAEDKSLTTVNDGLINAYDPIPDTHSKQLHFDISKAYRDAPPNITAKDGEVLNQYISEGGVILFCSQQSQTCFTPVEGKDIKQGFEYELRSNDGEYNPVSKRVEYEQLMPVYRNKNTP